MSGIDALARYGGGVSKRFQRFVAEELTKLPKLEPRRVSLR